MSSTTSSVTQYRNRRIEIQAIRRLCEANCEQAGEQTSVIAAWGTHGARNGRGDQVAGMLADAGVTLHCLGVTKDGQPKHPLYLADDTPFQPYQVREVCHA